MMPGEKAGDFKGSMLKLLTFMGKFKFALGAVFVFAIASTVFNIVGPKVLSTATTELFEGVTAKIAGTGGIRFDVVGAILLTTLALYGFFCPVLVCSRLVDDPCYAENLLPFATAYCPEDRCVAYGVF